MNSVKFWSIGAIAVVLGAGGVTALVFRDENHPKPPAAERAEVARSGVQVKFVVPRKGALERLCIQPGSVHSFESVPLFAKVPGFLKLQKVDIGDRVKEGALLAQVDVPDIEAQVERTAAGVEKAESQLVQMKSRVEVAQANYQAAQAEVTQAEAMARAATAWVKYRTIQLGRMRDLVVAKSIEDRLYDESKERHDASVESEIAANVKIATTKANVVAANAKIDQAKADVIEAQAEIKVAKAELKKAKVDLDYATIRAPFSGVITYRSGNPGDFVRAANGSGNIEPLLTIDRTDLFRVVVLVPDRDVKYLRPGKLATMEIDALPGQSFEVKVSRIATRLDPQTRLMRVELDLPNNKEGQIYHGMYGQVTIVLDKGDNLLSIPTSCIAGKSDNGKATVYVVRKGRAEKVRVTVGLDSGLRVAVSGLAEGEQVILNPVDELAQRPNVIATEGDDSATLASQGK